MSPYQIVVEIGTLDASEDIWKTKEEDTEENVEEITDSQTEHQLVEVTLDQLPRKPKYRTDVSNDSKYANKYLDKFNDRNNLTTIPYSPAPNPQLQI